MDWSTRVVRMVLFLKKKTTKCELFWLVKHCCCTCIRSNYDLRSVNDISQPEKERQHKKYQIKANQPLTPFYEVGQTHQVSCWSFQAQMLVNILTSLKLNAVQVIKFTGEYNYTVLCEGGGDNICKWTMYEIQLLWLTPYLN